MNRKTIILVTTVALALLRRRKAVREARMAVDEWGGVSFGETSSIVLGVTNDDFVRQVRDYLDRTRLTDQVDDLPQALDWLTVVTTHDGQEAFVEAHPWVVVPTFIDLKFGDIDAAVERIIAPGIGVQPGSCSVEGLLKLSDSAINLVRADHLRRAFDMATPQQQAQTSRAFRERAGVSEPTHPVGG